MSPGTWNQPVVVATITIATDVTWLRFSTTFVRLPLSHLPSNLIMTLITRVSVTLISRHVTIGKKIWKPSFCRRMSPGNLPKKGILLQNMTNRPRTIIHTPANISNFPSGSKPDISAWFPFLTARFWWPDLTLIIAYSFVVGTHMFSVIPVDSRAECSSLNPLWYVQLSHMFGLFSQAIHVGDFFRIHFQEFCYVRFLPAVFQSQ